MITFLLQSRFSLFGCCSFRGVFAWDILALNSGQSDDVFSGEAGVFNIDGLAGLLISEAKELREEFELLLDTAFKSINLT